VPLLTKLPKNRRYIAIDLPGHGYSSHKPKTAYTHTIDYIVDLEHVRRGLKLDNFSLIGHSLGGMISGIYTATYPDKIDKFVAIDGLLPFHQPNDQVVENLRKATDMLVDDTFNHKIYKDLEVLSERITRTVFYKGMDLEVAEFMLDRSIQMLPEGHQFTYDKRLRYPALIRMTKDVLFPLIKSWTTPILYLIATDGFKQFHHPSYIEGIEYLNKHSTVTQLELPGPHHLHMSNTEDVSAAVISFLGLCKDGQGSPPPFEFKGL